MTYLNWRQSLIVVSSHHQRRPNKTYAQIADKGYTGNSAKQVIEAHGYIPHVKERGKEVIAKKEIPGYRSHRWVVELTHSWLNRFRKLLVRFEKLSGSYVALIQLAFSIICWRKIKSVNVIYG
jgi:putative transposase